MRICGALVTALIIMSLTACGGGGGGSSASTSAPTPTPTPTPTPSTPIVPPVVALERLSGGAATTEATNQTAFGQSPNVVQSNFAADANFKSGNLIFRGSHDGEGPLLNARTCQGCHTRDGRGAIPPDQNTPMDAMSIRLSLGLANDGGLIPDPNYGLLLQTFGLDSFTGNLSAGLASFNGGAMSAIGEGFGFIDYQTVSGTYDDGTAFELRQPTYKIKDLSYGDFAPGIQYSARVAPQLIGLGLLDAVADSTILERSDPNDSDSNGISGRAATIFDPTTGASRVGRIGAKASVASLLQQTVSAYRADMGVTSSFAQDEDCTQLQISCIQAALSEPNPNLDGVDLSNIELALVEFYVRLLAVPARRGFDQVSETFSDDIVAGRALFFESGCESCHRQTMQTADAAGSVLGQVALNSLSPNAPRINVLSEQTIFPYTDLLLHDMGGSCQAVTPEFADGQACTAANDCIWVQRCEGLADGRPEGDANGAEWRTAPLWGLGLVTTVNEQATFLHDGRARSIEEAILWHGGEAATSQQRFLHLSSQARSELLAFLESL